MLDQRRHISFSVVVAILYAACGVVVLDIYSEVLVLASVLILIAGLLPDIDASDGEPARELGGLLAAVSPLLLLEYYPVLKVGGVARMVLAVICCYALTRLVIVRALQKFTVHRGMLHSIPAAILTFQLTYLLFWDQYILDRLYLASAAFVGFLSHLFLDAYGNLDIVGKATGKAEKKPRVLKLFGPWAPTLAMYAGVVYLGLLVAKDF